MLDLIQLVIVDYVNLYTIKLYNEFFIFWDKKDKEKFFEIYGNIIRVVKPSSSINTVIRQRDDQSFF